MRKHSSWAVAGALLFALSIGGRPVAAGEPEHDHKAPHGGTLLETGDEAAHLELVHDAAGGKVTVYILDEHAKGALAIADAPKLNLKTEKGNAQVMLKAVDTKDGKAAKYEATDDALKSKTLTGRIAVTIKEKKYNIDVKTDGK